MMGFALLTLGLALAAPPDSPQKAPSPHVTAAQFEERLRLCEAGPSQKAGCAAAFRYLEDAAGAERAPASVNLQTRFHQLQARLLARKIPEGDWVSGAFNAWLASLDPHAKLMAAEEEDRRASADKILVQGAGAKLRFHRGRVFVGYNMDGSPAESMGLRPGDELLAINGQELSKLNDSAKRKALSDTPSPYRLHVLRDGKALDLLVNEKRYFLANVEGSVVAQENGEKEGRLRVRSFDKDNTCSEMRQKLNEFAQAKVARVRLDLSNNPGGLVREALCAAGLFLGPGKVFAKLRPARNADAEGLIPATPAHPMAEKESETVLRTISDRVIEAPLVVEINQNSASAAEMLAAALQDHGRARVTGVRSFGKGSMQSVFHPWNDPKLYLTLTTHRIFRPSGTTIQYEGVTPDQVLSRVEGDNFPRERELTL